MDKENFVKIIEHREPDNIIESYYILNGDEYVEVLEYFFKGKIYKRTVNGNVKNTTFNIEEMIY